MIADKSQPQYQSSRGINQEEKVRTPGNKTKGEPATEQIIKTDAAFYRKK